MHEVSTLRVFDGFFVASQSKQFTSIILEGDMKLQPLIRNGRGL